MPVVLFIAMAYVVAKLFMNVFGLAADTCLQCFIACEEMGVGNENAPHILTHFVASQNARMGDS